MCRGCPTALGVQFLESFEGVAVLELWRIPHHLETLYVRRVEERLGHLPDVDAGVRLLAVESTLGFTLRRCLYTYAVMACPTGIRSGAHLSNHSICSAPAVTDPTGRRIWREILGGGGARVGDGFLP